MDLTDLRPWLTLIHVLAAFGFFAVHGASMVVLFKVRSERDRTRVRALLELSMSTIGWLYASLGLLLLAGILSGIAGAWWTSGRLWIWAAVGLLVLVTVAMYATMTRYYIALRSAVGIPSQSDLKTGTEPVQRSDSELSILLVSSTPLVGAAIGIVGMVLIIWLMVVKPF